ncbi:MAG: hypothetical protein QOH60_1013 [Mycobacterium sp.]|jgi:hypothetical protein|nr:hypothetical protein [Mycobacterium sp.]
MISLIDFILNLFRDPVSAQSFVVDPEQSLLDAGLNNVTSAQIQSVAATAVPSLALGNGDPVVGLQSALTNHYGWEPVIAPSPTWSPTWAPQNEFAPSTLSNNDTSLLSPHQDAGANAQQGAFNLGFGDVTLFGSHTSTTTTATDGSVITSGHTSGDIVTGDGAVLGTGNSVNNGNIHAGQGSAVTMGHDNSSSTSQGNTTAGHDVVSNHDGTVIQTSHGSTNVAQGNTDVTSVHGNQTNTNIHGVGNSSGVDNSHTVDTTHTVVNTHTTNTNIASNNHTDVASHNSYDASTHDNVGSLNSHESTAVTHESTSTYAPTYDHSTHDNTTLTHDSHNTHLGF